MPKFTVILKEIEIYEVEVDADNESEACVEAWEFLTNVGESNRHKFHVDSDSESEAEEIE